MIEGAEYFVSEATLTDFFPYLLNRVHLSGIWRQWQYLYVGGKSKAI